MARPIGPDVIVLGPTVGLPDTILFLADGQFAPAIALRIGQQEFRECVTTLRYV
jgi:hypothetical protein